jgi:asparagine synthase (glutamine-hydrolysing)
MCGYLFHNFKPEVKIQKDLLSHRGPDNYSFSSIGNRFFHHWRLSIIDLSDGANQPIESKCGNYRMVYNGEVYNYNSLRLYLEEHYQHDFITSSDTEVLFYGLIYEGSNFVKKLNGMFSFVFYDKTVDEVILARDYFGIKPLFYSYQDEKLIVSSEIGPIHHLSEDTRQFNKEVQGELISCGFVYGTNTLYKGVEKLEPGSILKINLGLNLITELIYYSPDLTNLKSCDIEEALSCSVVGQLISDVPIGVLNSGGIDSGLVTYLVGKYGNKEIRAESYTAVFTDTPRIDERSFAKNVAEISGLNYNEVDINSQELGKSLKELILFNKEVLLHPNAYNIFLLGKEASKKVKVLLSGEGSDELLQGYKFFRIIPLLKFSMFRFLISRKKNHPYKNYKLSIRGHELFRAKYAYTPIKFQEWFSNKYPELSYSMSRRNSLYKDVFKKFSVSKDAFVDLERLLYLPPLLDRQDRMLMASSIEGRVPFLDNYLLGYLKFGKSNKLSSLFGTKIKLTEVYHRIFGIRRKKFAFAIPLKDYVNALKDEIDFDNKISLYSRTTGISKSDLLKIYNEGDFQLKWILLNLFILCPVCLE